MGLFPGGIFVSFLPKGHTHNEMDQLASRLSVALRHKSILTRQQMYKTLEQCISNVRFEQVRLVANTKKYLNPKLNINWTGTKFGRVNQINNHQYLRIWDNPVTQRLECRTRQNCLQEYWSLSHALRHGRSPPA